MRSPDRPSSDKRHHPDWSPGSAPRYFTGHAQTLAAEVIGKARDAGLTLATAESCTGGLIAACLTDVPGASDVFMRGFVTYTNEAKNELLGVSGDLFARVGAVSEEVARAMAEGALQAAKVDLACAVTGIAGPGGATRTKPVGLVHMAVARKGTETLHAREVFPGDRAEVRNHAVEYVLSLLLRQMGKTN